MQQKILYRLYTKEQEGQELQLLDNFKLVYSHILKLLMEFHVMINVLKKQTFKQDLSEQFLIYQYVSTVIQPRTLSLKLLKELALVILTSMKTQAHVQDVLMNYVLNAHQPLSVLPALAMLKIHPHAHVWVDTLNQQPL